MNLFLRIYFKGEEKRRVEISKVLLKNHSSHLFILFNFSGISLDNCGFVLHFHSGNQNQFICEFCGKKISLSGCCKIRTCSRQSLPFLVVYFCGFYYIFCHHCCYCCCCYWNSMQQSVIEVYLS